MTFMVSPTLKKSKSFPVSPAADLVSSFFGCVALLVCKLSDLGRLCAEIYIFGGVYVIFNSLYSTIKALTECNAEHRMQAGMKYLIPLTEEGLWWGKSPLFTLAAASWIFLHPMSSTAVQRTADISCSIPCLCPTSVF